MPKHRPFTLKPELVRGCTRRCVFCLLPNMPWRDEPYGFMAPELFRELVRQASLWHPRCRLELAARGEPSFHPQLTGLLAYAREHAPLMQLMMASNGDLVRKGDAWFLRRAADWFAAGLNFLLLDCYTPERYAHMVELFAEDWDPTLAGVSRFFEDDVHPYGYHGPHHRQIIIVDATPGKDNVIRKYHNAAGNVDVAAAEAAGFAMRTEVPQKICVRPFRELPIDYDGTVPICCNDWLDRCVLGHFPAQTLAELWEAFDRVRAPLVQGDRAAVDPCCRCSERPGMRAGLETTWFRAKEARE